MSRDEMTQIADMITGIFRFLDFSNPATFELWFEILKGYDVGEVRAAVTNYARFSKTEPTPADILDAVRNVRTAARRVTPDYVDWRSVKSVRCRECNDKGYVMVVYPTGYEELRPCNCAAGHERFPYLFSEEFDRKAKWIVDHDDPDKAAMYMYGTDAETVRRSKYREVRSVTASGLIEIRKEATR